MAVVDAAYEKIRAEDEADDKEEEKQVRNWDESNDLNGANLSVSGKIQKLFWLALLRRRRCGERSGPL